MAAVTRRRFLQTCAGALAGSALTHTLTPGPSPSGRGEKDQAESGFETAHVALHTRSQSNWRGLLPYYTQSTRANIVTIDGRRALLSSRLYPGTYVRDAVFWGPLALNDTALGLDCYRWFAESQLGDGQIRTAVPLHPDEADKLQPQDDEGTLLFLIASEWLARAGCALDRDVIERAYRWVETHVQDDLYVSSAGPFRYWADTLSPDRSEAIVHNVGLLALARRALVRLGLGGVTEANVRAAQAGYRSYYVADRGYLTFGAVSQFADVQDISAVFPEFLSRYLYDEPMLDDAQVVAHVTHALATASVMGADGKIAGVKVIAASDGSFLPPGWFYAPGLNAPGDYQNGGYWPMYTLVALALAFSITGSPAYEPIIGALVEAELGRDHQSKEVIRLTPGDVGSFDPQRADYTWNALIRAALEWCGLA